MSANRSPKPFSKASMEQKRESKENSCYFCNESFELGQLQGHLKHCGSILEQCPLRCGAWIQRRHRDTHVAECPRTCGRGAASPTHARVDDVAVPLPRDLDPVVEWLEKEVRNITFVLTEEVHHREVQDTDLDSVRARLLLLEERTQHFLSTLVSLRSGLDDQAERSSNWEAQFKHDLANVQLALQELQSQQLSTAMRLETAVSGLVTEQRERELLEQAVANSDMRSRTEHRLDEILSSVQSALQQERDRNELNIRELEQEVLLTRQQVAQQVTREPPELSRLSVLEVATADARAECSDLGSKVELISRDVRALTKSYLKMRTELNDFQARVSFEGGEVGSDNGHLIWRIDNFSARMKEAKETDNVLSSPLFRTSKYGYTIKAEVSLNGVGSWRGRHVTGTLRVTPGRYDSLLVWPCDLRVNIALKDQARDRNQAMDIVKTLDIRRKSSSRRHDYDDPGDGQSNTNKASENSNKSLDNLNKSLENLSKSSDNLSKTLDTTKKSKNDTIDKSILQLKRQYFFIPHASLDKFDYVKNDAIFFEFVVNE